MMSHNHREFKKNYKTEIIVNGENLPLNHFIQETLANMIVGFLKTLKEVDEPEEVVEIKIKKINKNVVVDAHTYP